LQNLPPAIVAALPRQAFDGLSLPSLTAFNPEAMLKLPTLKNSIGMELKLIPPGSFTMGDSRERQYTHTQPNARPHAVTLTQPFFIGVTEVTNAHWHQVMGKPTSYWKEDDFPVNGCKWGEAVEFCRRLSAQPVERDARRHYRLPTEAEWEYACRAGSQTRFSFGDDASQAREYAWYGANSEKQAHPVGCKKPNRWGLYDMHGNVFEWCGDWYGEYTSQNQIDPTGPNEGFARVFRGGFWEWAVCGSAYRPGTDQSPSMYGRLGLRVVMQYSEASTERNTPSQERKTDAPTID
jgi:formylglycine-generating enzyme required for sulfatase activity